eukprot:SAG11_NODE_22801_length_400_cov_0.421927_1_plen_74_part_10
MASSSVNFFIDYTITDILHGLVVESAAEVLDFVNLPRRIDDIDEMEANIDDPESGEEDEDEVPAPVEEVDPNLE